MAESDQQEEVLRTAILSAWEVAFIKWLHDGVRVEGSWTVEELESVVGTINFTTDGIGKNDAAVAFRAGWKAGLRCAIALVKSKLTPSTRKVT